MSRVLCHVFDDAVLLLCVSVAAAGEVMLSEIPRKRHCSGAPSVDSDTSNRPYLDLEKMQDKVRIRVSVMSLF